MLKFIFHIIIKKKEKLVLDKEMVKILEESNYVDYEEWKNKKEE